LYTGVLERVILAATRAVGQDSTLNHFGDNVFAPIEGQETSEEISERFYILVDNYANAKEIDLGDSSFLRRSMGTYN
jgi:hypothetical protein